VAEAARCGRIRRDLTGSAPGIQDPGGSGPSPRCKVRHTAGAGRPAARKASHRPVAVARPQRLAIVVTGRSVVLSRVVIKAQCQSGWGYLVCYDMDGTRLWHAETGQTGGWGFPYESPLILGGKVFVQTKGAKDEQGKPRKGADGKTIGGDSLTAFDLASGKKLWSTPCGGSTTGSPIPCTIDGVPLVFVCNLFFRPADGKVVCTINEQVGYDVHTPVFQDDRLFTRSREGKNKGNEGTVGRFSISHVLKFAWKTKGEDLGYEVLWKSIPSKAFFLSGNSGFSSADSGKSCRSNSGKSCRVRPPAA